jgi:transcriptional regulator with XRE-family HTH domain
MAKQPAAGFARLLRLLRRRARKTQQELAQAATLSPRTVSDLERGIIATTREDTAGLLSGALGLAGDERDRFVAAACGELAPDGLEAWIDALAAAPWPVVDTSVPGSLLLVVGAGFERMLSTGEYRIGRDPSADIVLNDVRVSWYHAVLRIDDDTCVVEDSGSVNGTWVGPERASRVVIGTGVVVRFGDQEDGPFLRFEPLAPARGRAPGELEASLAAEMLPFILMALRADGSAVLAESHSYATDAVGLGRGWLQQVFGRQEAGEPLPPVLAEVIDQPGNTHSRAALSEEIRAALVENATLRISTSYALASRAQPAQSPAFGQPGSGSPSPYQGYAPPSPGYHQGSAPPGYTPADQGQRGTPPVPGAGYGGGVPSSFPAPDDDSRRYLRGQCPERVRVGETFSVLASIAREAGKGAAAVLKPLLVPSAGRGVVLVLDAPGLEVLSGGRRQVDVPFHGDSEPVMFELRAIEPGPVELGITAWADGTYLGQLDLDTTATRHHVWRAGQRGAAMAIDTTPDPGAVSLVVRHDPRENAYRFEFRDEDNPEEVACHLAYQPGARVERLVAELDRVARGRAGFSAAEARDYLANAGVELWTELIPVQLREQFWERQERISQLTILSDCDAVPWELLYPLDPGHDAGFLVEQFPVTRAVFGRRPARSLSLSPACFVVPQGSPKQAWEEVSWLSRLLSPVPADAPVIGELTPLLDLIRAGDFGLLHFACHNAFDAANGSAISLDKRQFTPLQLNRAAVSQALARTRPTVFMNACRSAGVSPSYHRLDGWARKFLEAGAGAFIGSLWAVRDSTALDFADELYRNLRKGTPLGEAVRGARLAAADEPGDPTWLAYTVYGDPRATLR